MTPSQQYRDTLRLGIRLFMTSEIEALLGSIHVNELVMNDLEACYELLMDHEPHVHEPFDYQPRLDRRANPGIAMHP